MRAGWLEVLSARGRTVAGLGYAVLIPVSDVVMRQTAWIEWAKAATTGLADWPGHTPVHGVQRTRCMRKACSKQKSGALPKTNPLAKAGMGTGRCNHSALGYPTERPGRGFTCASRSLKVKEVYMNPIISWNTSYSLAGHPWQ